MCEAYSLTRFGECDCGVPCWLYRHQTKDRRLVAIHEAAHAVVACRLGLEVVGMSLDAPAEPGRSWSGRVSIAGIGGDPSPPDPAWRQDKVYGRAAIGLASVYQAGVIAELRHIGAAYDGLVLEGGPDLEVARQLLGMAGLTADDALHRAQRLADGILAAMWPLVGRVADDLEQQPGRGLPGGGRLSLRAGAGAEHALSPAGLRTPTASAAKTGHQVLHAVADDAGA